MTDFDRFKLRKARQLRNKIRTLAYYRLKNKAAKERAKKSAEKKKEEPKQKKGEAKQKKSRAKRKEGKTKTERGTEEEVNYKISYINM
jgi:hypothetical protein